MEAAAGSHLKTHNAELDHARLVVFRWKHGHDYDITQQFTTPPNKARPWLTASLASSRCVDRSDTRSTLATGATTRSWKCQVSRVGLQRNPTEIVHVKRARRGPPSLGEYHYLSSTSTYCTLVLYSCSYDALHAAVPNNFSSQQHSLTFFLSFPTIIERGNSYGDFQRPESTQWRACQLCLQ